MDTAVLIEGRTEIYEGREPKIILSSVAKIDENDVYSKNQTEKIEQKRIYIRVPSLRESNEHLIGRICILNPGQTPIVFYDESTSKYCIKRDARVSSSDKVISRLKEIFGEKNVILK